MRIGWIGLGRMGRPMVENLVRKGFDVTVQNRSQDKVQEIVAMGATAGESYAAMGATLDAVHVCLPGEDVVREVIAGPSGVLSNAREGLIIVDHSTIHPDDARDLARFASEKGVTYLDAPVSGAGPYAERGELTIMCGGDPKRRVRSSKACWMDPRDGANRRADGGCRRRVGHEDREQRSDGDEPGGGDGGAVAGGQGRAGPGGVLLRGQDGLRREAARGSATSPAS